MARTLIRIIAAGAVLLAPTLALAAFNDVTLTTSASFPLTNGTLVVNGAGATIASITSTASSITFTLQGGSSMDIVNNSGLALLTTGGSAYVTVDSCASTQSRLVFTVSAGANGDTVTITPSTKACASSARIETTSSSGSSSSGSGSNGAPVSSGGGGGGGGVNTTVASTPVSTPASNSTSGTSIDALKAQLSALLAQLAALQGGGGGGGGANTPGTFTRTLKVGSTGNDVKALQVYLNTHGFTVASSGPGSSGNETTRFGKGTKAALIAFQNSVGISPASGLFGALTRAYVTTHP